MNDHARFLTVSNLLSISRAVLVIPFVAVLLSDLPGARLWACLIMAVAALTDKLDGSLARRLNQVTDWGKILDPLADKIGVAAGAAALLVLGAIPLWFLAVLVGRDLLILCGGLYLKMKKGILMQSNETGKWTIGLISLTLFLAVTGLVPEVVTVLVWLCLAMLAVSLALYARRFVQALSASALGEPWAS